VHKDLKNRDSGEVVVSAEDIMAADGGVDVCQPEFDDPFPTPEDFPVDRNLELDNCSDASYAPDGDSRRSILGSMVRVNGSPTIWSCNKMDGIAGSSFEAECCGCSVCTKQAIPVVNTMNFAGVCPCRESQHADSTSVKTIALNPNSLGAARSLGIRVHSTRCAIARKGLDLKCSITQDMLADFFK
jgi:hypothetical protein